MKERPILFSAPMVRAILAGEKTQTRRIAKRGLDDPHHLRILGPSGSVHYTRPEGDPLVADARKTPGYRVLTAQEWLAEQCHHGQPGERLWVRETWGFNPDHPGMPWHACYRADPGHEYDGIKWRPSIHMPRAACRLKLEITGIRVERLNDCSPADAYAEGAMAWAQEQDSPIKDLNGGDDRMAFRALWESINGAGSWDANPWVWVIDFRRIDK